MDGPPDQLDIGLPLPIRAHDLWRRPSFVESRPPHHWRTSRIRKEGRDAYIAYFGAILPIPTCVPSSSVGILTRRLCVCHRRHPIHPPRRLSCAKNTQTSQRQRSSARPIKPARDWRRERQIQIPASQFGEVIQSRPHQTDPIDDTGHLVDPASPLHYPPTRALALGHPIARTVSPPLVSRTTRITRYRVLFLDEPGPAHASRNQIVSSSSHPLSFLAASRSSLSTGSPSVPPAWYTLHITSTTIPGAWSR